MFDMTMLAKTSGVNQCTGSRFWSFADAEFGLVTSKELEGELRLYCSPRDGGLFYATQGIQHGSDGVSYTLKTGILLPQERANLVWHIYQSNLEWYDAMLFRGDSAPDMHAVKTMQSPSDFPAGIPIVTEDWLRNHRGRTPSGDELITTFMGEIIRQTDWPMNPSPDQSTCMAMLGAAGGCWVRQKGDDQDVIDLWDYCAQRNWIQNRSVHSWPWKPTWDGRLAFEERSKTYTQKHRCFVAMWFDTAMKEVYDQGIEPAIRAVGYEPYRVDREWGHIGRLDERIEAQIRQARFLVADFTSALVVIPKNKEISIDDLVIKREKETEKSQESQIEPLARGGVYYEAGIAQGLGIPVVFACNKKMLRPKEHLHFDTRQYRHLEWQDSNDLYQQLVKHILANPLLGRGPQACDEVAIAAVLGSTPDVDQRMRSFMQELIRQWDRLGDSSSFVPVNQEALDSLLKSSGSRDQRDMEQFWLEAKDHGWIELHDVGVMGDPHHWGLKSLLASGRRYASNV